MAQNYPYFKKRLRIIHIKTFIGKKQFNVSIFHFDFLGKDQ
jgi:hypothetical protein